MTETRTELLAKKKALLAERAALQDKLDHDIDEARAVFDLIFKKKFRAGGDWLERTKRVGKKTSKGTGLLGGVRHMYTYLHPNESIQARADRQLPNSLVQGPASNLGFVGGYFSRKLVWDLYEKHGVPIGYFQCNAVHDSLEAECLPVNIPIVIYLCDHAFSTCLHRWMRDVIGFEPNTSFESDTVIGATMAETHDATRWDAQVSAIEKSLKWKQDNLKLDVPIDAIMPIVERNAKIVFRIRQREIERQLERDERVSYDMLVNERNSLKLGLTFKMPEIRAKAAKRKEESWKKELQ